MALNLHHMTDSSAGVTMRERKIKEPQQFETRDTKETGALWRICFTEEVGLGFAK